VNGTGHSEEQIIATLKQGEAGDGESGDAKKLKGCASHCIHDGTRRPLALILLRIRPDAARHVLAFNPLSARRAFTYCIALSRSVLNCASMYMRCPSDEDCSSAPTGNRQPLSEANLKSRQHS
jgi:hypothetical protein